MTISELFNVIVTQPSQDIYKQSKDKWDSIAKPIDGLGDFEEMVSRIAAIRGQVRPDLSRKAHVIMCADNGVYEEGVSQTSQSVTRDVALLMGERKSSVGIMAKGYPIDFFVYDVGINSDDKLPGVIDKKVRKGTANFVKEPAMSKVECLAAIEVGIDAVKSCSDKGYGIISTGEMGIGNTTTSTALLCALKGLEPSAVTGRGAGLSDEGLQKKIQVIEKGLELHIGSKKDVEPHEETKEDIEYHGNDNGSLEIATREDTFNALRCFGGFDIAGLVGVFIGGAMYHVPVVIDGVISAVAALVAERLIPGCKDYMLASHMGREKGMGSILEDLGLKAVIHANLALGEGTGAILLFPMLDMVMNLYSSGTNFEDTVIEQYERFQ
ncbi:nicotinate-nucleotide--dimethylbenzimidazole phosphoribosyltransferase [Butyrivibrio sp. VCB2006]|uniref:nicotinate-nucleotide--dimethylbenzimidazole phosphoribosyltransferase n=1 Tax=Butyrivibrio sp. VCB2006 TaxID=1280679 RepID=UPI0004285EBE|nr:nicotinate-nucleotide--dimethylbenzimidazole phosphoribosyltransferase [Butyrivibrio sp. VCB2006]